MDKLEILAAALAYIEENLSSDIRTEDVAQACYCSKTSLENIFRCINGHSVREYMIRRRMMQAAKRMAANPEENLLEIALDCGYGTHESFSRAFKSVWNCNPSEFRMQNHKAELYPKRCHPDKNGGLLMGKNVDISELYELFLKRKDCYFVCTDIHCLIPINEISHKAGDLAILESLKRLEKVAGEDDIVFRIGGDEFVILTAQSDKAYADGLCQKINEMNGECFAYEDRQIPLTLYTASVKYEGENLRYAELFQGLHTIINGCKGTKE